MCLCSFYSGLKVIPIWSLIGRVAWVLRFVFRMYIGFCIDVLGYGSVASAMLGAQSSVLILLTSAEGRLWV